MAVKMKVKKNGTEEAPFYRIIVADSRSPETEDSSTRSEHTIEL